MKASELEWSDQTGGFSYYKKFLLEEIITTIGRHNTMKCQLQSMSGTLLDTHMSATVQNKFQVSYLTRNVSYINKCQVSYLEMLGTYPIASMHETVRY